MATIPGIMLDIGANVARMQTDMQKLVGTVKGGFAQIESYAQKLGIALSAAFVVREAVQFGEQVLETGKRLVLLSQSTGLSVESLSSLKYAAEMTGVDLDGLAKGVERMSRNLIEAAAGTGTAKDSFKALGVSLKDNQGNIVTSDAALGQIADKFAEMKDGPAKTALAIQIFGRAGAELIPFLNKGSEGLADLRAEAEKLGVVMSSETAQQLERITENFKRMHTATQGVAIAIMSGLAPTLENLTNIFLDLKNGSEGYVRAGEKVGFVLKSVASAALVANTYVGQTLRMLEAFGGQIEALSWGNIEQGIKIWNDYEKQSTEAWTKTSGILARIWDKDAEDALRSVDKLKKGLKEGPMLPTADDKSIEKVLEKLQEEVEAIQMGSDALDLYKKGLHDATAEQQAFGLYLIRTIEAYEQSKKSLMDRFKAEEEDQKVMQEEEKAILGMVDAIKMHAITANMDEEAIAKFQLTLKGASQTMVENVEAYFKAIEAAKEYNDQISLVKGLIEETKSPMDRYEDRMKEIQGLLDAGMISTQKALEAQGIAWEKMVGKVKDTTTEQERIQIEFGKKLAKIKLDDAEYAINEINREATIFKNAGADEVAVAVWAAYEKQKVSREWQDGATRGMKDYYTVATNAGKNTEEVFTRAFKGMEDALVDFTKTGKLNFTKLVDSILTDLMRLTVRQAITGPLAGSLASSGVVGVISSLLGGGSGGPGPQSWSDIGYQGTGYEAAGLFHSGGVVGSSAQMARSLPAPLMMGAPRLHSGLQPDEFNAILKRDEGVFTPEQMKAMGSQTNISIGIPINAPGADPRKMAGMRIDLENELEPAVRRIIARYV